MKPRQETRPLDFVFPRPSLDLFDNIHKFRVTRECLKSNAGPALLLDGIIDEEASALATW